MANLNPNSTNYFHSYEPNTNDLTMAMDYLPSGEPALRTISNISGNIIVQGNVSQTVLQGTIPWVVSGNSSPNGPTNPIFIEVVDQCLKVENCVGTSLKIEGNVGIQIGSPLTTVSASNPMPVTGTITANVTFPASQTINGNVGLLVGGLPLATGNPIPVDITDTCLNVQNCEGTRLNVNSNSIIMINELPVAGSNPLPVTLGDECISIQNCGEGSLSVIGIVKIETGQEGLPVSDSNPLIVNFPEGTCIPVTNCGTDGVLNISGNITVEGVAVTVENPFPVDLRNTCIGVENCAGTSLEVKLTDGINNIGFVLNDNDGQLPNTWSVPVENFNMIWNGTGWDRMPGNAISGVSVNITNSCLSVANCPETVLGVAGDVEIYLGGSAVSGTNPLPVTLGEGCIEITNCGTDGVLNVSGAITVEGVAVTVENPFPVDLTNTCLSVQNCPDTTLQVEGSVDASLMVGGSYVSSDNPVPVSIPGCVSIQNCGEGSLSIMGQVQLVLDGQTVSDSNPLPVTGTFEGDVSITGTNLDAFARLRVSNPYTLFDGALRYRDNPLKWSESFTVGTTTITFNTNTSTISMTHTGPGTTIRQSKQVFSYQPGKSLLVMMSFVGATPITGLNQKIGFFGEQNGVYFETDDSTLYMVKRDYTTGVVSDIQIAQSNWNGDRLDGTGPSGYTINVSKSQIWWCDIEWLGVGSVRTGFIINGQFIVCHTFHHANILGKVYMTTATLPVRYELNTSEEGGIGTLQAICSTVISEGGYVNRSIPRAVGTSLAGRNLSDTVYRPLVCIRLKSTNLDAVVLPTKFEVYGLQNAAFSYQVILNPTLTSASWTSAGTDSSVEYDISATDLSGGTVIDQGIFVGTNKGGVTSNTQEVDFSTQLGRTLANVSDIWCLAAIATTNNDDAVGTVSWQEHP